MNYAKHYDLLIAKALARSYVEGYTEKHHILPTCVGGTNDRSNIVVLTAKEHYIAHALLARMYGGKLWSAAYYMGNRTGRQNSLTHAKAREEHAIAQVEIGHRVYSEGKGIASLSTEERKALGKKAGEYTVRNKLGIHAPGGYSEAGKTTYTKGVGMFSAAADNKKEWCSKGGISARELRVGIHSPGGYASGGLATKAKGVGIFALTREQLVANGKKNGSKVAAITNAQVWVCDVCGFTSTAAGVVGHQKKWAHVGRTRKLD